jgi:hypothetical protein
MRHSTTPTHADDARIPSLDRVHDQLGPVRPRARAGMECLI